MRRQVELLLCAVQFLTRIPTPSLAEFEPGQITRAARYFPLVGQVVGGLCAGALLLADHVWTGWLAALIAVLVGVLVTGAFHEDGLADTADGLGGGRDPARRLEIMKDSRLGTYGVLALGFALSLKVAALAATTPLLAAMALIAAHGGGRAAAVVVMAVQRHVTDPEVAKYKAAPDGVRGWEALVAVLLAAWPLLFLPLHAALAGMVLGVCLAAGLSRVSRRLIGGYTGDVLGGVEQVFECGFLLGAAATLG